MPIAPVSMASNARPPAASDGIARVRAFLLLQTGSSRNASMEGLRGFAVLLVFFVHAVGVYAAAFRQVNFDEHLTSPLPKLARDLSPPDLLLNTLWRSHYGVDLFFLLSGFLIVRIATRTEGPLRYGLFVGKRLLRIYPPFLASLAVCIFSNPWLRTSWNAVDLVKNLLFLYGCPGVSVVPYNHVTWSLFNEVSFYLVFPLIYWLIPRAGRQDPGQTAWRGLLLLGLALLTHAWLPRSSMFYFGIMLGMADDNALRQVAKTIPSWLAAGAFLGVVAWYATSPSAICGHTWFTPVFGVAGSLLFIQVCYGSGWLQRVFSRTPLRVLGNISYSFYLIHSLAIGVVYQGLGRKLMPLGAAWSFPLFMLSSFAAATLAAVCLFAVTERWYFQKHRTPATVAKVELGSPPTKETPDRTLLGRAA